MKKGQASIASFFGKAAAKPGTKAGGSTQRSVVTAATAQNAAKENDSGASKKTALPLSDENADAAMKKLAALKPEAQQGTPEPKAAAAVAEPEAAAAAAVDDEDDDEDAPVAPAPKRQAKKRPVVLESESESEVVSLEEEGSEAGDGEQSAFDVLKGASKAAPKKKRKKATAKSKVDGVGAKAIDVAGEAADFDPAAVAREKGWKDGVVPYEYLSNALEEIGEESKRTAVQAMLARCFRSIIAHAPDNLLPAVYLCLGKIAPAHENIELGLGNATIIKAIAASYGKSEKQVKAEFEEEGDLGAVAHNCKKGHRALPFGPKPKPLTIDQVFKTFKEIALTVGTKSQEKKIALIKKLMADAKPVEAGFIARTLSGKLRIGLAEQTVLVSLAHAAHLHRNGAEGKPEELAEAMSAAEAAVKTAYSECPMYDRLVPALLEHGAEELPSHVHFTAGVPIKPMLAKPTTSVTEVLDKFTDSEFTCEYKYDGERAQVHVMEDGRCEIYSRNSENNTGKYPDVTTFMKDYLQEGVTSVVLDCEVVAYDREAKKILSFNELARRPRKNVKLEDVETSVCLFVFDCLYLNGEALLTKTLVERREAMTGAVKEVESHCELAKIVISKDVEELQTFMDAAVSDATEGLIVKTLDATYEPSKRSLNWLKLKKDYMDGCGDTFDLVVVGANLGQGKRAGLYGAFLLAAYNPESEEYQTISKIGTGFSEEQLVELHKKLEKHVIPGPKSYYRYTESAAPQVWFDAAEVWEVKAADLSISPVYTAAMGIVNPSKGISIRFPRLIRVRDDKNPEDATSAEQVADMYRSQAVAGNGAGAANSEDDLY